MYSELRPRFISVSSGTQRLARAARLGPRELIPGRTPKQLISRVDKFASDVFARPFSPSVRLAHTVSVHGLSAVDSMEESRKTNSTVVDKRFTVQILIAWVRFSGRTNENCKSSCQGGQDRPKNKMKNQISKKTHHYKLQTPRKMAATAYPQKQSERCAERMRKGMTKLLENKFIVEDKVSSACTDDAASTDRIAMKGTGCNTVLLADDEDSDEVNHELDDDGVEDNVPKIQERICRDVSQYWTPDSCQLSSRRDSGPLLDIPEIPTEICDDDPTQTDGNQHTDASKSCPEMRETTPAAIGSNTLYVSAASWSLPLRFDDVLREGWLCKVGGLWPLSGGQRWFTARVGELAYVRWPGDRRPPRNIPLTPSSRIVVSESAKGGFAIVVTTTGRDYRLSHRDRHEAFEWTSAISRAAGGGACHDGLPPKPEPEAGAPD